MAVRVFSKPKSIFHTFISSASELVFQLSNTRPTFISTKFNYPICSSWEFSQESQHGNLKSHFCVFQRYGFPPSELNDFLKLNKSLVNFHVSDIEKSLKILLSFNLSRDFVVSLVYTCPTVLEYEFLKNWKTGVAEIGVSDLSALAIQNILEVSRKFDLSPNDISSWVKSFKGFGFGYDTVCRVLEVNPMVILLSAETIYDKVILLEKIGFERKGVDWIFSKFAAVLSFGLENRLIPLLKEFKDLGYRRVEVKKEIAIDPRILGLEVGELSQCLRMLRSLKCRSSVKEEIFSNGTFRAGYEVKLRVDCLCKYGLIRREAFSVLWREPRVILYDIKDIERKIDFLVDKMKLDVQWLVDVPQYLGVSFDKKIVPRFDVIEYLKSKGALVDEVGLKSLINLSRLKFYNLYVKPYPGCENIYGRFAEQAKLKNQHPVGMWKLFKPQKYTGSKEDAKNIRSFMDK